MSSEWQTVEIGSLCLGIYDGPHATPKKTAAGPIFLGISSLNNGQLDLSTLEYLSEEDFGKWTRRVVPQAGDIVFSYETRLGQVAVIPAGLRCCLGRRMALMRVDPVKAIPDYLLYAYLGPEFQEVIRRRTIHGSTVDRIPLVEFASFPISVPPLDVQKEVVGILRALDDRIALLRETNATLEAIAQALFKSWFVDFDPVRAKMEGRAPEGMDEATAALFPDGFDESELGAMPRGWRLTPFGELLGHTIGGDWGGDSPDEKNDTRVAIIRGTDIPDMQSGLASRVPIRYTSAKKLTTRKLQDGDIVLEVSGGSKDQPTGRSIYLTSAHLEKFDCPVEPASFCRLLRPISSNAGVLLGQHLTYIYSQGKTWEYQNQSTGIANFQTAHFLDSELVAVPPADVLALFAAIVRPLIDRSCSSPIPELVALRDTLLPRLISGQLRLPEAVSIVEEAMA